MKKLLYQILTISAFLFIITTNSNAQNLQFNQAVFYEYGPAPSNGDYYSNPVFTSQLIVAPGKVLKITSGGAVGTPNVVATPILINDKMIALGTLPGSENWLPSGTYEIKVCDSPNPGDNQSFVGFLSGVLYDIIP
jgi:hypothetical protein